MREEIKREDGLKRVPGKFGGDRGVALTAMQH